jgi:hypothetical protein
MGFKCLGREHPLFRVPMWKAWGKASPRPRNDGCLFAIQRLAPVLSGLVGPVAPQRHQDMKFEFPASVVQSILRPSR